MFGLDIGSSEVKLLQLRKHGHNYRVVAATAGIEAGEGDYDDSGPETFRAINRCLGAIGGQTQFAVCSVCGPEVAVRCFKFPSLPANEIAGAVLLEAAQVCPFNTNDSTVDYQLIPNGDGDARGVLVGATNEVISGKEELVQSAALKCVLVDVDGLALLNCYEGFCGDLQNLGHDLGGGAVVGPLEMIGQVLRDLILGDASEAAAAVERYGNSRKACREHYRLA